MGNATGEFLHQNQNMPMSQPVTLPSQAVDLIIGKVFMPIKLRPTLRECIPTHDTKKYTKEKAHWTTEQFQSV
eukprot:13720965-Ditylum_brightwellii.AAC.2